MATFPREDRSFLAKIIEVIFAKSVYPDKKDNPAIQDCVIVLEDKEGFQDQWRGEMSSHQGHGTMSSKTQYEITHERLMSLESAHPPGGGKIFNGDYPTIKAQLVDKYVDCSTKVNGNYLNIYIGSSGRQLVEVENKAALDLIAQLSQPVGAATNLFETGAAEAGQAPADDPFAQ